VDDDEGVRAAMTAQEQLSDAVEAMPHLADLVKIKDKIEELKGVTYTEGAWYVLGELEELVDRQLGVLRV
jgi:hypothetical protein